MKHFIKKILNQTSYVKKLNQKIEQQGKYPAGHYYSPIPSKQEVDAYIAARKSPSNQIAGIAMNEQRQYELLAEYARFYNDIPFPETQTSEHRYYYQNIWFSYSDAIFLYCFLRKHLPKRIIEVGSGFSSAVMLDTIDAVFSERPDVTFIEPYPDRLMGLLRQADQEQVSILDKKIQDVPLDAFSTLEQGDLLFIDSSHVVKCGSDLQFILFEVLPILKPGVYVHFHDVFHPFDYPAEWLEEGRYWNENYFLRAFLSYNSQWSIQFFMTFMHHTHDGFIKEKMPLCSNNTGGGLYLQRLSRS